MRHGKGVDEVLVAEQKPLESQNETDTLLVSTRTRYKSMSHIANLQQSRFCKYSAITVTHLKEHPLKCRH